MAAYSADVAVENATMTQLTDAAVTSARLVNLGGSVVRIGASLTTTPPATPAGFIPYPPGEGLSADVSLDSLFPSFGGVDIYLFGYCEIGSTTVSVDHA
jgi:hypothetical protein